MSLPSFKCPYCGEWFRENYGSEKLVCSHCGKEIKVWMDVNDLPKM